MHRNVSLGFFSVVVALLLLISTTKAAPTFQDISGDPAYDDSTGDGEASGPQIPVIDALAFQRLLMLLDSLPNSGPLPNYRLRRPESKASQSALYNSIYGPLSRNSPRTSADFFGSKMLDRKNKEDKRGSYTPCFFNPVSCFGK